LLMGMRVVVEDVVPVIPISIMDWPVEGAHSQIQWRLILGLSRIVEEFPIRMSMDVGWTLKGMKTTWVIVIIQLTVESIGIEGVRVVSLALPRGRRLS